MSERIEDRQASGVSRDEWTMTGTLDLHGTPMPFESHWVRAEWADAEIARLKADFGRIYQSTIDNPEKLTISDIARIAKGNAP